VQRTYFRVATAWGFIARDDGTRMENTGSFAIDETDKFRRKHFKI
jgi:hypothetical protein